VIQPLGEVVLPVSHERPERVSDVLSDGFLVDHGPTLWLGGHDRHATDAASLLLRLDAVVSVDDSKTLGADETELSAGARSGHVPLLLASRSSSGRLRSCSSSIPVV
jgi:hypothetical protein